MQLVYIYMHYITQYTTNLLTVATSWDHAPIRQYIKKLTHHGQDRLELDFQALHFGFLRTQLCFGAVHGLYVGVNLLFQGLQLAVEKIWVKV